MICSTAEYRTPTPRRKIQRREIIQLPVAPRRLPVPRRFPLCLRQPDVNFSTLHAWIANVLVAIVIVVVLGVPVVRFIVVAVLAVTILVVVKTEEMVPPEVTDNLLKRFSLSLPDRAAVDAQRRERRLVRHAPLDRAHDKVRHCISER